MSFVVTHRITAAIALCLCFLTACSRGAGEKREYAWVVVQQITLRDRVAAVYNRVGTAKNGERVEVLEKQKRFARIRLADGKEGWVEQRYLAGQEVFDALDALKKQTDKLQPQSAGLAHNALNMHVTPGRDTDYLYQLKEGERIELLRRTTAEKPAPKIAQAPKVADPKSSAPPEPPPLEDWWLARDAQQHVGWVLGRMVDVDAPLDVAQYAEGQRIVAARVLNYVNDARYEPPKDEIAPASASAQHATDYHRRAQYLVLLTEPRDGLPFDYNQARVFTWNLGRHRYETAYREHNLVGLLPVTTAEQDFGKEGRLPTFTLRLRAENGETVERLYKMNGPIVRRVTPSGEQPRLARPERPKPKPSAAKHKK